MGIAARSPRAIRGRKSLPRVSDNQTPRTAGALREYRRITDICAHKTGADDHADARSLRRIRDAAVTRERMVSRITLVRAPNPSAMTLSGTNSYLVDVGNGEAIVIDPGPAIMRHIDALIGTARERDLRIVAI